MVGIVENPSKFDDEFALLAPGDFSKSTSVKMFVDSSEQHAIDFRPPGDRGRNLSSRSQIPENVAATLFTLVVGGVAMFFVALVAAASFVVIAQRRMPQLGMLAAVGANKKQVRMTMLANGAAAGVVSAVLGAVLGLAAWIAVAPAMEGPVGSRIDAYNVPWWLVLTGMLLAVAAATAAAWWPARSASRVPIVSALSGRPPRPTPVHRSALLSAGFVAIGAVCLTIASHSKSTDGVPLRTALAVLVGTLAVVTGVLLTAPLTIRALAKCATRLPIASRLALRDLGRYQARSGAALAAISLALGIPIAIIATATAAENQTGPGNLAKTQMIVRADGVDGPFVAPAADIDALQRGVDALTESVGGATSISLDAAKAPDAPTDPKFGGVPAVTLGQRIGAQELREVSLVYVGSPQLLQQLGVDSTKLGSTDVLTAATGDLRILTGVPSPDRSFDSLEKVDSEHVPPQVLVLARRRDLDPGVAGARLGLRSIGTLAGGVEQSAHVGTTVGGPRHGRPVRPHHRIEGPARGVGESAARRDGCRHVAGLERVGDDRRTDSQRDIGRPADPHRTGASSFTRRAITATTSGGLALLGVGLGIAGAYAALIAGRLKGLTPLPWFDLVVIAVGHAARRRGDRLALRRS